MDILWIVSLCCINVLFRSTGTLIDRYLFQEKNINFFHVYLSSNTFPLVFGIIILLLLGEVGAMWHYFWTWPCVLASLGSHFVALSFSYAFRHCKVQQVILKSKLSELVLPFAAIFPIFAVAESEASLDWKTTLPLIISWLGMIPLFYQGNIRSSLFDKTTLFITASLLFHMISSSAATLIPIDSWGGIIAYAVAMLMWRLCFILPFYGFQRKVQVTANYSVTGKMFRILFCRAFVALTAQVTFVWCVLNGPPLLIWPIINMAPLMSWVMSQMILKETPHRAEMTAFVCFLFGSALPAVL